MNPLFYTNTERDDIERYVCIKRFLIPNRLSKLGYKKNDTVRAYFDLNMLNEPTYTILVNHKIIIAVQVDPIEFEEHFILLSEQRKNKIKKLLDEQ